MPFMSGELKYLYELLIEVGHPISPTYAAKLFALGELAAYVQDVIQRLLPPACAPGDTKCEGYDLYRCEEVLGAPQWVRTEINSTECGYVPPPPDPEIKKEGIRLYQARLDAFFIWIQLEEVLEEAQQYLSDLGDEWIYAQYQYDKYRGLLYEWTEALDNFWRNKGKIDRLQDDLEDLEWQLSDLYTRISDLYTELLNIQEQIDNWEYLVERYAEDVSYAQELVNQAAHDLADCMEAHGWRIAECMDFHQAWLVARDLFEDAKQYLEEAQATLSFYEIQKQSLLMEVDDAWNDVNDVQFWIADIEDQIEELLGVLADYDTIIEQIDRFEPFVDYWRSEMWWLEDEMEVAQIRLDTALWRYEDAEREWNNARRAWSRFKKEYPVIAQEILDEW